ncbi:MAG: hydroxymethylglutaryl-CoA lyase [Vicinamibacteraceae bacterium]|nr:hydroxymethylglutaryl-CoA lyase [Vicinamibacteraceae bacterium]
MPDIVIHEVGLRDGLQIERDTVPTATKAAWARRLAESGVDMIQLGSFVHREKVPQMADTDELFAAFRDAGPRPVFTGLVLNEKGLDRGLACGVRYFCMGVSASETHSRKNTGMTTAEAQERIIGAALAARAAGAAVQVSVQSAFGCSYEGIVPESRVLDIVRRYVDAGFPIVSLADTAGHATPDQVERLFTVLQEIDPSVECACHFHDTYGLGLLNCHAALRAGVTYFEAAFAGLGGCPFTAVTGGNVCTEDLVHLLHRLGLRPDIALDPLIDVAREAGAFFKRDLPGRIYKTGAIKWATEATKAT